jgi:hypothetical protein
MQVEFDFITLDANSIEIWGVSTVGEVLAGVTYPPLQGWLGESKPFRITASQSADSFERQQMALSSDGAYLAVWQSNQLEVYDCRDVNKPWLWTAAEDTKICSTSVAGQHLAVVTGKVYRCCDQGLVMSCIRSVHLFSHIHAANEPDFVHQLDPGSELRSLAADGRLAVLDEANCLTVREQDWSIIAQVQCTFYASAP